MKTLKEFILESRDNAADKQLLTEIVALKKEFKLAKTISSSSSITGYGKFDVISDDACFAWYGACLKIAKQIFKGMQNEEIPSDVATQWFKTTFLPLSLEDAAGESEFDPKDLDNMNWAQVSTTEFKNALNLIDDIEDADETRLNIKGSNSYYNMIYPVDYQDAYETWKKTDKNKTTDKIYKAMVNVWNKIYDYELK